MRFAFGQQIHGLIRGSDASREEESLDSLSGLL